LSDARDPARTYYIRALGEIGDARAFEPLSEWLHDVDYSIVMAVIEALRKIDNPRAVDLLHQRLDDESDPDRGRLAQSLAGFDLLRAAQSLGHGQVAGRVDVLFRAVAAAGDQLRALLSRQGTADEGEDRHTAGVEAMRELESFLRDLKD